MTALLSAALILAASDLKTQDVPVPEWGGTVRVRMMTGAERDELNASLGVKDGKPDMTHYAAKVVAMTAIGEDGARIFSLDHAVQLAGRSMVALDRVFTAAAGLNKMLGPAVDVMEKNSEPALSGSSSSGGPSPSDAPLAS